jgi:hypothetical protein
LVEQEVGSKLLVLITSKVSLNDEVSLKAKTTKLFNVSSEAGHIRTGLRTYSLDSLSLLFGHADGLGTRGQCGIIIVVLCKQLQEPVWARRNELCKLGISSTNLLKDRFEHLGLLLDDLSKLLELRVVAQEVKIADRSCGAAGTRARRRSTSGTASTASVGPRGLSGSLEEIDGFIC